MDSRCVWVRVYGAHQTHAIRRYQTQEAQSACIAQELDVAALCVRLLNRLDARILHRRPGNPASHALVKHLLRFGLRFCLAAQVVDHRERRRVHGGCGVGDRERAIRPLRDVGEGVQIVCDGPEPQLLVRPQPLCVLLDEVTASSRAREYPYQQGPPSW